MSRFTTRQRVYHLLIKSRWKRWLFPALCCAPYVFSLLWLTQMGQVWIVQVMLAPLLMFAIIGVLTLLLAIAEFRLKPRGRR